MNELGYKMTNTADESYTAQTNAYVRKFEEVNGLPMDGVADSKCKPCCFRVPARRADGSPAVKVDLPLEDKEPLTDAEVEKQVKQRFTDFLTGEGLYSEFELERKLFTQNCPLDLGFMSSFGSRPYAYTQSMLLFRKNINGEKIPAMGIKNRDANSICQG